VLAARSSTSIPQVRVQIARLHGRRPPTVVAVVGDVGALALAGLAAAVDRRVVAGAAAVLVIVALQRAMDRRPPPRAVVLGLGQMAMGLGVILLTALGVMI